MAENSSGPSFLPEIKVKFKKKKKSEAQLENRPLLSSSQAPLMAVWTRTVGTWVKKAAEVLTGQQHN